MKKKTIIVSAILTAAMMAAPMSVFAAPPSASDPGVTLGDPVAIAGDPADITIDKDNPSGQMTATYSVSPSYTVTIPASVTLSSTQDVTAKISAGPVMLEEGKCVVVKLTKAQYTEEGNEFNAKVGSSTARYAISVGAGDEHEDEKRVRVGDAVATFVTSAEPQTSVLTFSNATGATYAGTHTETLTFSLAVGSAVKIGDDSYAYTPGQRWIDLALANGWLFDEIYIYSDQSRTYQLLCEGEPVSPDDSIDGSKTYQWEDFLDS